jgi:hypothetical protein
LDLANDSVSTSIQYGYPNSYSELKFDLEEGDCINGVEIHLNGVFIQTLKFSTYKGKQSELLEVPDRYTRWENNFKTLSFQNG